MKERRMRWTISGFIFLLGFAVSLFSAEIMNRFLTHQEIFPFTITDMIEGAAEEKQRLLFVCLQLMMTLCAVLYGVVNARPYQSDTVTIAGHIKIPKAVGQNQYGSARQATEKEKEAMFPHYYLPRMGALPQLPKGGVVLGKTDAPAGEHIYMVTNDTHSLCLGATRSGKTRTFVLQSVGSLALAGESMVLSDPKGELYQYTAAYLEKKLGYTVYAVDFKNPEKSNYYNFLQPMIDAVDQGKVPQAVDAAWDLVNALVPEPQHGEPIWTDGQKAVIASAAMAVVFDNQNDRNRRFQNLTNVYTFISEMCKEEKDEKNKIKNTKISEYMRDKPESHPARTLYAVAEMAPARQRGSFFTGALATLRLFVNPLIYGMSNSSEVTASELANKKCALFIILPDEKTTYYSLAALMVTQLYEQLVAVADKLGGRLPRRVNFVLDEFGNFTKIPSFDAKLTVGGGRGIRFNLILQSFSQLDEKYGKEVSKIIRGNCETWLYLQSDDPETRKELSDKLGKYTTSSYQLSASHQKFSTPSSSHSISLVGRELMTPDEIGMIQRPYTLVTSRGRPSIFTAPDLSKWRFNTLYGLGDEAHNIKVRMEREAARPVRPARLTDEDLWGIWKLYGDLDPEAFVNEL